MNSVCDTQRQITPPEGCNYAMLDTKGLVFEWLKIERGRVYRWLYLYGYWDELRPDDAKLYSSSTDSKYMVSIAC